jgi:succinate dehydrogenase hydrophobic anchor subunit
MGLYAGGLARMSGAILAVLVLFPLYLMLEGKLTCYLALFP